MKYQNKYLLRHNVTKSYTTEQFILTMIHTNRHIKINVSSEVELGLVIVDEIIV
jgi:hypothetical protein